MRRKAGPSRAISILILAASIGTLACGGPAVRASSGAPALENTVTTPKPAGPLPKPLPIELLRIAEPVSDGYNRDAWKHWTDEDGDCQDTRQEVLIEESEVLVTFKDARECKVATGRWTCPYTGEVFTDPGKLDVDHMVPLGVAHASGGHSWEDQHRERFANDLSAAHHLIAVKASANRSKGKKGPHEWLPSKSYGCEYVTNWVQIKLQWRLTVSSKEKSALTNTGCFATERTGIEERRAVPGKSSPSAVPAKTPVRRQSNCPVTSACGCSKFRKAECNTSCCKWTVGKGCGCR